MKFYKVREELLNGKNISDLPLRVTFYARVSTDSNEQLNSLDNQITFFENYIKSNSNWTYIKGYIDEGISGSSVKKRKNFLKMIEDSKNNSFDLIVTKEVSRFSRNLSDSIKYTQVLMSNDVGVYFQSNGINTYDTNSEFILNMMGSVAQEEVKRLSSRIKWGHKEAIKKGHVLGSSSITGYKKDHTKLVIVESEAIKIRKIFELYSTNKYGFNKLGVELYKIGITNSKGNIYDKDTLKRIIRNPKYKGYYRGHTTETIDYRTKKRIIIPDKEQIIYKDNNIPIIVPEDIWNKANNILNNRSKLMKLSNGNAKLSILKYPYTTKIKCKYDFTNYQRISNKNKPRWVCSNYLKYKLKTCTSPIILESEIDDIFIIIMEYIFENKNSIIEEMYNYYTNIKEDINITNDIRTIKIKKEKILELNIDGSISNEEFMEKNNIYNEELKLLENNIKTINKEDLIKEFSYENNVKEFVNTFLDKIIVSKINNNRNKLLLEIYLNDLIPLNSKLIMEEYIKFQKNSFNIQVYSS
jgi:DNA invertase Pin-like site-specific DNA recombinase